MTITRLQRGDVEAVVEAGFYNVDIGGIELQFYFKPSNTKTAYIFSPGWVDRQQFQHPYFQRSKWLLELDGIGLSLADPCLTLGEEIQIGWFIGTEKTDYSQLVVDYIAALLRRHSVAAEDTLFFGSSAGGFSSLVFAALLRGSRALAVNPQISVLRFHDVKELEKYLSVAFPGRSLSHLERISSSRFDVFSRWSSESYIPTTKIMLNMHDAWHFNHHLLPLINSLKGVTFNGHIEIVLYSDPVSGHVPPGKDDMLPVIREFAQRK